MECPHQNIISEFVCECDILKSMGVAQLPGPARKDYICAKCCFEWEQNKKPPDVNNLTVEMEKMLIQKQAIGLPCFTDRFKFFMIAMWGFIASGFKIVNWKTYSERLDKCESNKCGHYRDGICLACGCPPKEKAIIAAQACPVGEWDKMPLPLV